MQAPTQTDRVQIVISRLAISPSRLRGKAKTPPSPVHPAARHEANAIVAFAIAPRPGTRPRRITRAYHNVRAAERDLPASSLRHARPAK